MAIVTDLTGKTAVITGSNSGIGLGVAKELARAGSNVVLNSYTNNEEDHALAQSIADETGVSAQYIQADMSKADECRKLIAEAGACDILVNNAGIQHVAGIEEFPTDKWDAIIAINLSSAFHTAAAAITGMRAAGWGRIINVTSVVGSMGNAGQSNYAATKAGAEGMARSLARELGSRSVTVNCIAPGFIDTDMTRALADEQREVLLNQIPLGRLGSPDDVAAAVAFLASDAAQYITGETLHVNGGLYMG